MNDREKKLTFILVAAVLIIGTMFLYTSYSAKMKKNRATYKRNAEEISRMEKELDEAASRSDEMDWLAEYPPIESTHGKVASDLAGFTEKSALRSGVTIGKRPRPMDEDVNEFGAYRSAVIRVTASAADAQLYHWLVDLQSPNDARSITSLKIIPKRTDDTKMDCELEVTQWYSPLSESSTDGTDASN